MAFITVKKLRGLPVYTVSGERVGKIADVTLDTETHAVRSYAVSKSNLLAALLPDDLHIAPNQVVSVTEDRMTVLDATVNERVAEQLLPKVAARTAEGSGAAAREMEAE